MSSEKWSIDLLHAAAPPLGDPTGDWRTRLAAQRTEDAERRRVALAAQSSTANTPDERIRIWERLHALPLPREAEHPLLELIAKSTGLTLGQLHDEQQQRAERALATKAPASPRAIFDPYCVRSGSKR